MIRTRLSCYTIFVLLMLLTLAIASTIQDLDFYKGEKIGNVPDDTIAITSSRLYKDRLYILTSTKILSLDKLTGAELSLLDLKERLDVSNIKSFTVGLCDNDTEPEYCIYVAVAADDDLEIYKMTEPEGKDWLPNSITKLVLENSLIGLVRSPFLVADDDATVWVVINKEGYEQKILQIKSETWSNTDIKPMTIMTNLNTRLVSMDLDFIGLSTDILMTDEDGVSYFMESDEEEFLPVAFKKSIRKLNLKLGGHHRIISTCWDQYDGGIYALSRGKHMNIFKLSKAQSDEASTRAYYQRSGSDCKDKNQHCANWQRLGMCEKREAYMTQNCARACQTCGESMRMSLLPQCTDNNHLCSAWAAQGYCKSGASKDYLVQNCKKSCNLCPGADPHTTVCQDLNLHCESWASSGRCATRKEFMSENCPASCDMCSNSGKNLQNDEGGQKQTTGCNDLNEYCESWAMAGKCENRTDYMFKNCPRACGLCGGSSMYARKEREMQKQSCEDTNKFCLVWAANNLCNANPGYMNNNCRAACGLCQRTQDKGLQEEYRRNSCVDRSENCETWSKFRLCTVKTEYMKQTCPKACEMCDEDKTDQSTNRIYQPVSRTEESDKRQENSLQGRAASLQTEEQHESNSCTDNHQHCHIWAASDYCNQHRQYMEKNCKASCKVCSTKTENESYGMSQSNNEHDNEKTDSRGTHDQNEQVEEVTEAPCVDEISTCQGWVDAGLCNNRKRYMEVYCKKSCKFCTSAEDTTTTTTTTTTYTNNSPAQEECRDRNSYCPTWAKQNKCGLYKGYMDKNCQLSCRICTKNKSSSSTSGSADGSTGCQDKHSHCKAWSEKGYCSLSKDYMSVNCKAACGMCS